MPKNKQKNKESEVPGMSYQCFQRRVQALLDRSKSGVTVRFNAANGRFYANLSDGSVIISNAESSRAEIRWGSGHVAFCKI